MGTIPIVYVGRAVQVVGCHSDTPDVYLLGVRLHQPNLRSHIDGGAANGIQFSICEDFADTEI